MRWEGAGAFCAGDARLRLTRDRSCAPFWGKQGTLPPSRDKSLGSLFLMVVAMSDGKIAKRCWFTFPTQRQVEQPILWEMSRKFPEVSFDIRQASVRADIGIMAVLLTGGAEDVLGAMDFLRARGVLVEPIEKSVVEG
jgi:hypothetical protein